MAVVVITRLRLRDASLLDDFFAAASGALEEAQRTKGNLAADALADANNVWWTATSWQDRDSMGVFVDSQPHKRAMAGMDEWCDEATFADWEQSDKNLPDWNTSFGHLVTDGQVATLTHASPANERRNFPAPVVAS
jgi:hypothetical protein